MTRFTLSVRPQYILMALLLFVGVAVHAQGEYPKLAPFTDIFWPAGTAAPPLITVSGQDYEWLAIDDSSVDDLVAFALLEYEDNWDKRVAEDLVQVLTEFGEPPSTTVTLLVREPGSDATQLLDLPMTEENRSAVMGARYPEDEPPLQSLSAEQARADLDAFEAALRERYAYFELTEEATLAELEAVRAQLNGDIDVATFASELGRIIGTLRDGHAGVRGFEAEEAQGYAPFLVSWSGDRAAIFEPGRTALVDADHPYLVAIDDVALEQWLAVVATYVPDGSAQYVSRRALGSLRELEYLRTELGLPESQDVRLTLESETGESKEITLPLSGSRPLYGEWPQEDSSLLTGNVGYLRLASMDETAAPLVREWMERFETTDGLIVDVRGNGGGSREALLELGAYLLSPGEAVVVNAAKYRLAAAFDEDHLENRFMYRAGDEYWSEQEKAAIERFAAEFEPEWEPPEAQFSDWHYLVLSKHDERYSYDAPVVVLSDAGAFSATDIFLGALEVLPNVTLLGEASGGGSALKQDMLLPNSGLEIVLASMASFRPNGLLYDGRGVEVDVEVAPDPSYFLNSGSDSVLDEALRYLEGR